MQLTTTFRGLNRADSATATSLLERNASRLDRFLDQPVPLRAVIDAGPPEHKVTLNMSVEGEELVAQGSDHDLAVSITTACERLRGQLVRMRRRRETIRTKNAEASS